MTAHPDDTSDFLDWPPLPAKPARTFTLLHLFGAIGVVVLLIAFYPYTTYCNWPAARRVQCLNNLKQIGLAVLSYESAYKALPPAYTTDAAGKPLHSWRTLILPYMDQQALHESIDLSKPWDDPVNAKARATMVATYQCPEVKLSPGGRTTYLAIVASNGCFLPDKSRLLSEITDDHGSTLMLIDAPENCAVDWMAPIDADEMLVMGMGPENVNHRGGMTAAFADGRVKFLRADLPAAQRRAMISISGKDEKILDGD